MSTTSKSPYVLALVNGNAPVIRELYTEYFPHIESWIKERGGDRADALDTFHTGLEVILFQAQKSERIFEIEFKPYFFRICRNKWIDTTRAKKKEAEVRSHEENRVNNSEEISLADEGYATECLNRAMEATFLKLSDTCQQLINLTQSGSDTDEIAVSLNMTNANTVYRRKFGCMKRWRELLEAHPLYQVYKKEKHE